VKLHRVIQKSLRWSERGISGAAEINAVVAANVEEKKSGGEQRPTRDKRKRDSSEDFVNRG
jgi:hypothetical protein